MSRTKCGAFLDPFGLFMEPWCGLRAKWPSQRIYMAPELKCILNCNGRANGHRYKARTRFGGKKQRRKTKESGQTQNVAPSTPPTPRTPHPTPHHYLGRAYMEPMWENVHPIAKKYPLAFLSPNYIFSLLQKSTVSKIQLQHITITNTFLFSNTLTRPCLESSRVLVYSIYTHVITINPHNFPRANSEWRIHRGQYWCISGIKGCDFAETTIYALQERIPLGRQGLRKKQSSWDYLGLHETDLTSLKSIEKAPIKKYL